MSKINDLRQLSAEIKQTAQRLELWGTDLLDRLIIDWKSRKDMNVVSVIEDVQKDDPQAVWCLWKGKETVKLNPNCVRYEGDNQAYSWIWELFGKRRRSGKQGGRITGWLNGPRNNYLLYRFRQMGYNRDSAMGYNGPKKVGKAKEYWRQAGMLMTSKAFILTSMNHVIKGWEKNQSVEDVSRILKEVVEIVRTRPIRMDYLRVYIDKDMTGSGVKRPLGVPPVSWRIYLHMLNAVLVWWTIKNLPVEQHAYQPGKGTWTAWQSLMKKLVRSNIYEFDLSNFFGNVDLRYNCARMKGIGVPEEMADYLYKLNQSIVGLRGCGWGGEDKVDETIHRRIVWNTDGSPNPNLALDTRRKLCACVHCGSDPGLRVMEEKRLLDQGFAFKQEKGVPQGASTSCGLSILNLGNLFSWNPGMIMYADDGLVFPNSADDNIRLTYERAGIVKAEHKSSWVKKNGAWEKSLKFLGLEYIPAGVQDKDGGEPQDYPRLRGYTRGEKDPKGVGSRLEFTVREQLMAYLEERYAKELKRNFEEKLPPSFPEITVGEWIEIMVEDFEKLNGEEKLGTLFKEPAGPSLMSRMYNGSWEIPPEKSEGLKAHKKSWCARHWPTYLYGLVKSGKIFSCLNTMIQYDFMTEGEKKAIKAGLDIIYKYSDSDIRQAVDAMFVVQGQEYEELEVGLEDLFWEIRKLMKWFKLDEFNSSSLAMDWISRVSREKKWKGELPEPTVLGSLMKADQVKKQRWITEEKEREKEEELKIWRKKKLKKVEREARKGVKAQVQEMKFMRNYRQIIHMLIEKIEASEHNVEG
jgi:hypothetical protein